jgi:hypothetical protein
MTETVREMVAPPQTAAGRVGAVTVNQIGPGPDSAFRAIAAGGAGRASWRRWSLDNRSTEEDWWLLQAGTGRAIIPHRRPSNVGYARN